MRRALIIAVVSMAALAFLGAGVVALRQGSAAAASSWTEPEELVSGDGVLRATITAAEHQTELGGRRFATMLYNGGLVGPTLRVRPGDRIELTLVNGLGEPTNLHVHGLHVSPTGASDNIFREVSAGDSAHYAISIPTDHQPGVFWYHSHQHHLSYGQVLGGLSGLIVVDGVSDLLPADLGAIEQRVIALRDFQVAADPSAPTVRTVNGRINPSFSLAPGETQLWRLANIGAELFYEVALPGHMFHVVGEDGVPVWRSWEAETLVLPSGKRFDVLVQGGAPGSYPLMALSYHQGCVACPEVALATLTVAGPARAPAALPAGLAPERSLAEAVVDRKRTLVFSSNDEAGEYAIDGQLFVADRVDQRVRLGAVEEWTLRNEDDDEHPFHIHVNDFEVVSVNGQPYEARGRQDTVILPGHGEVVIRIPFDDFTGRFVYHCHILFHGDGGMMGVVEVVA